jgi:hypothetical protein
VLQAINRQIAHYAQHIGQIVFVAKHLRSSEWQTLSIPRGRSEEFKTNNPEGLTRDCRRTNRRAAATRNPRSNQRQPVVVGSDATIFRLLKGGYAPRMAARPPFLPQ